MFKKDFPLLSDTSLIYLDSASSTQKPDFVLKSMDNFYKTQYSNVHRGTCSLSVQATDAYESARRTVADFIKAPAESIVFTKGATESINLVVSGLRSTLKAGDEVLISMAEHHANFVPWQQACLATGATFKVFNVHPDGSFDMDDFRLKLTDKTKIVAVTHISNVLGIINPINDIITLAHHVGAQVLVDGAQSVAHTPVDVLKMDADFFVFSGHKLYAPTGIGVLYGKSEALNALPPYQFGGDMIKHVSVETTTFAPAPARFEAGTPPFVQAIGLASAIRYMQTIGLDKIESTERDLTHYLIKALSDISGVRQLAPNPEKHGIVAMTFDGIHPDDIATLLASQHICVRVGHHCAMPIHHFFQTPVSLRVSLGLYNTISDIDVFITALKKSLSFFNRQI